MRIDLESFDLECILAALIYSRPYTTLDTAITAARKIQQEVAHRPLK